MQMFSRLSDFNFGDEIFEGHGRFVQVNYTSVTLFVVETGDLVIYSDGFPRKISTGEAALIRFQESFMAVLPSTQQTRVSWCESVNPPLTPLAIPLIEELPISFPATSRLRQLLGQGCMLDKQQADDLALRDLKNAMGLAVICDFLYEANMESEGPPIPKAIRRVKDYIDENYQEPCSLDALAEVAALTPSYLIKKFNKYYGVTPTQYLWHFRAKKGVELLEHSSQNVSVIADECGFQNANHFSRTIKKIFGDSPRSYRHRIWQEQSEK